MPVRPLAFLLVSLSLGSLACGDDAGAGGGTDTTSASTTASSTALSSSSGGACLGQCLTPPPPGWNGPVLVADDDVSSCASPVLDGGLASDSAMPDSALVVGADPVCGCSCEADPTGCGAVELNPGCDDGPSTILAAPGMCATPAALDPAVDDVLIGAVGTSGKCMPGGEITTPGEVTFATPRDVCGIMVTTAGCQGTEVCVPATDASVCVWRHGAVGCGQVPAYPNESVLVAAFDDGRACEAGTCACGPSPNGCVGDLEIFSDAACATTIASGPAAAGCVNLPQPEVIAAARYSLAIPDFTCPVEPGGAPALTGSVSAVEDEVYTLCCRD